MTLNDPHGGPTPDEQTEGNNAANDMASEVGHAVAGPPPSAASLRAQAAALLEAAGERDRAEARALLLAREEARPKQPSLDEGGMPTVVTFVKYQAGREYQYAALGWKEGNSTRWVVTGQETRRLNWPGLLEFIGEANWPSLHLVTALTRIGPDPAAEAPVAEVMGRYGRVERTETLGQVAGGDPFHGIDGIILVTGGGGGQGAPNGGAGGGVPPFAQGGIVGGRGSGRSLLRDQW